MNVEAPGGEFAETAKTLYAAIFQTEVFEHERNTELASALSAHPSTFTILSLIILNHAFGFVEDLGVDDWLKLLFRRCHKSPFETYVRLGLMLSSQLVEPFLQSHDRQLLLLQGIACSEHLG